MATRPNTALDPLADKLRQIHTIAQLMQYLHEELGWPIDVDDWEVNLFDWQPEEINLKAEHVVKVKSIKQLRPLVSGQPWGIFFVEFNKGRLPITALRRVLNGLVPKGRAASGGHQTWAAHDLLFVSTFGEGNAREIALAHFTDESAQGDLPTLRVLGWDDDDTPMQLGYVAQTLRDKLRWPANTGTADDLAKWRVQWSSAFSLRYGQVINDSKTLALVMAELAKRVRRRVNTVLALESDRGHLRQMHKAFKDNLIADLSEDAFADMFAQTITYGLFTARASRESGALVADNLADMVPSTNPFLKELLSSFLSAAGRARSRQKRVDFDELGINEVVTVLREVPMDAVLRSFNSARPGDDPVIHFYEDFLKAYDKAMRTKRGVFYTPGPVVQFIVRSVDEILKTEFGIEDGLASTITWGEYLARHSREGGNPALSLPKFCTAATPFVQVLDPATGTGTFIVEVITQIHAHMRAKWAKLGKVTKTQWQPLWVDYVKQHLLPRLYAFELMMAPYAIAHMKIGLKLAETGYTFPEDGPRVNVFLTNALEPAHEVNPELAFEAPMLAHEAAAANRVKEQLAATVVVGNPPYSGESMNRIAWIEQDIRDNYQMMEGQKLVERGKKNWLLDDYVKFLRKSHLQTLGAGLGCIGLVINNAFLDNPTFRGLRNSLLSDFSKLDFLNLHGSGKRNDAGSAGIVDQNVFEIVQGVCVALLTRNPEKLKFTVPRYSEILSTRDQKFAALLSPSQIHPFDAITPRSPDFYFMPGGVHPLEAEYLTAHSLPVVFSLYGNGVITSKDHFAYAFVKSDMKNRLTGLLNPNLTDEAAAEQYQINDNSMWSLSEARKRLQKTIDFGNICTALYRPFDHRFTYFDHDVIFNQRLPVTKYIFARENKCLLSTRMTKGEDWQHLFISTKISDCAALSNSTSTNAFSLPLWVYLDKSKIPNLSPAFLVNLQSALTLTPTDYRPEDSTAPLHAEKIFHYIYAVLHSPAYRQRYAAFLRTDFPRIPIPGSRKLFDALAKLGADLVAWHLLEHPAALAIGGSPHPSPLPEGEGVRPHWFGTDFSLQKVGEKGKSLTKLSGDVGKVFINATSGFANVHPSIWQHTIGGYQVLHKWLDDRRKAGRSLSQDDITHWLRVYAALQATQKLMLQVDTTIEANGGWPGEGKDNALCAFSQNHPPPNAATLAAEQMVQKKQLKAQKKAATTTKKYPADTNLTGTNSLSDSDDDLDELAAASGNSV